MCIRRLIRRLRTPVQGNKTGAPLRTPLSLPELLGKSVHISLMHLHYDGRLAAQYELYGDITRADDSAIVVRLSGSEEECRLRPDPRIFMEQTGRLAPVVRGRRMESTDADLHVWVGSVGIAYRNDLTRCQYLHARHSDVPCDPQSGI